MGYDIELIGENGIVEVERREEGGTYAIGGTTRAELNVTYNYARVYSQLDFSILNLQGKTGQEIIPKLREVVKELGTDRDGDYWAATSGNAGYAANILLGWAEQHPDATWEVS